MKQGSEQIKLLRYEILMEINAVWSGTCYLISPAVRMFKNEIFLN
jgi:hypothetical protein